MASSRSRSSGRMRAASGQGGEAVQPLAHLPAEAAGAGPVPAAPGTTGPWRPARSAGPPPAASFCRLVHGDARAGADHAPGRADDAAHQGQDDRGGRQDRPLVPPHELPQPVAHRRRTRRHRLVVQVALEVHRQAVGRLVAPVAVLLQRLHHDPVEVALDQPAQLGRLRPAVGGDASPAPPSSRAAGSASAALPRE